jgi:hypothetical protein
MPDIPDKDRKYLEEIGVENVRIALQTNANLAIPDRGRAWRWLKEQDEKAKSETRFLEKTTLKIAIAGTLAAIIAAVASVWALFR